MPSRTDQEFPPSQPNGGRDEPARHPRFPVVSETTYPDHDLYPA